MSMDLQSDFQYLARYLNDFASQQEFQQQEIRIGPMHFALYVDPHSADFEIHKSFFTGTDNQSTAHQAPFRLYVMQTTSEQEQTVLLPFLTQPVPGLQALSGHAGVRQFVFRDSAHQILKVVDLENRVGLLAYAKPALVPPWELNSPFQEFIQLHAMERDCLLYHGACLIPPSRPEHGVLITGPGGSGKSSLTAYALSQGWKTTGDDHVLLDFRYEVLRSWAVYRNFKLHPNSPAVENLPDVNVWKVDPLTGKWIILDAADCEGGNFVECASVHSVWAISLRSSNTGQVQNSARSPGHLLQRNPYVYTSMSTIQQIPYRVDTVLKRLKQLLQRVPLRTHFIDSGVSGMARTLDEMSAHSS